MRKGSILLGALLVSSLSAGSPDFNPKEPISLDLKDAKITDVVQTLGAIANLPVLIDPDVQGTVTIQLHGDPYDVALEKLSAATGLVIRIDNGRLIAVPRPFKVPPEAPLMPDTLRTAPRIPLAEYHKAASDPPPLFIRLEHNGATACYQTDFGSGEGRLLEVPVPGKDASGTVVVALVDFDPITRTSYIAVESPGGGIQRLFALAAGVVSFASNSSDGPVRVVTSTIAPSRACPSATLRHSAADTPLVVVRLEGKTVGDGPSAKVLFAPRVQTKAGAVFKTFSGGPDPDSGEQKGFVVAGYLSRDGRAAGFLLKARATWTDANDGKEYYFTQSFVDPESRFVPLTRKGVVAGRLSPGVATSEPVELRVYGEE
ncbi:MAG TPA: hypothetical protein VKS03_09580 [Thermoanaerobaculia bacterium]|nr:hypothetical protein [Thermoanaerobaculia bacterium]